MSPKIKTDPDKKTKKEENESEETRKKKEKISKRSLEAIKKKDKSLKESIEYVKAQTESFIDSLPCPVLDGCSDALRLFVTRMVAIDNNSFVRGMRACNSERKSRQADPSRVHIINSDVILGLGLVTKTKYPPLDASSVGAGVMVPKAEDITSSQIVHETHGHRVKSEPRE